MPRPTAALERLLAASQPQQIRAKVPFWLGNTRGRRGLEVLQRVIKEDPAVEVKKKAVFGISQSREPQAVDVLIENAQTNADTAVRAESIFWLGQKAGNKAAAAITERIEQDPDTEVKKKAVFALSQLPKDEGVPLLINVARTHSQSRGPEAGDVLAGTIEGSARARLLRGDPQVAGLLSAFCVIPSALQAGFNTTCQPAG